MERITNGKHITKGYKYQGYEIRNHRHYPSEQCTWWEAVNIQTGEADFHAHTKGDLKILIDEGIVIQNENLNE